MNEGNTKLKLSQQDRFNFLCHIGLPCFNDCCSDTNIFLTPYDLFRMRRDSGLSSGEFLKRYTISLLGDEGLPLVVLKMSEDEDKSCPFVAPSGCMIYHGRPWACRMYPLFPVFPGEEDFLIEEEFSIAEKPSCLGFREEKQWIIKEWKTDQGIDIYDKMNESYKEITLHNYFRKGNKLDLERAKMLYMACYDMDEFRRFLFETHFFDSIDIKKMEIEKIQEDEEELLSFGYRWVRFSLFREDTLKPKGKAVDKLLQARREEYLASK
ncbi:MAG: YkgJ family cysteine cluster protein [Thermodesulfovibrionales bacterium]|nr:YkgJ family cysteine cluster protein [Thermodesulfovibrionales bacterium]MCL0066940.1 YkgJ family cysteine cluster protein [Thermodesulfovibrionales bacterium]